MCGTKYCLVPYLQSIVAAGGLLAIVLNPMTPDTGHFGG